MDSNLILKQKRIVIRSHMEKSYSSNIAQDALKGLTAQQKYIPSKYFYDSRGSKLFDEICCLPEYYPTRTEIAILEQASTKIMESFERGDIVELGSGANRKIRLLLDAVSKNRRTDYRYVPVDVSKSALVSASEELLEIYPELEVFGIVADFTAHMDTIPSERPRLIIFLGSTIGNFNKRERKDFLRLLAASMNPEDRVLIGFDMIKPGKTLEAAYNDSRGITSAFNKNVLNVLNRELNAEFDLSQFTHVAFFNEEQGRVEMHLQAKQNMEVNVNDLDLTVEFNKDETIHTEICNKFSKEDIRKMASNVGLSINQWFFDPKGWFSLAELVLKI
jgi:L-histidine N-alpha-methyltransferase